MSRPMRVQGTERGTVPEKPDSDKVQVLNRWLPQKAPQHEGVVSLKGLQQLLTSGIAARQWPTITSHIHPKPPQGIKAPSFLSRWEDNPVLNSPADPVVCWRRQDSHLPTHLRVPQHAKALVPNNLGSSSPIQRPKH